MPCLTAGYTYAKVYPGYQRGGILSTMILGMIGAFVRESLFTLLQTATLQITPAGAGLTLPGILVAVIGTIVAIYLWGLIRRTSNA